MRKRNSIAGLVGTLVIVSCLPVASQVVMFNWPTEWLTQRGASVDAKLILDTAQVSNKRVTLSLYVSRDGQSRRVARKSFTVTDYTADISLGSIPGPLFGGTDFAKVEWSVSGTEDQGELGPIGVVALPEIRPIDSIMAISSAQKVTCESAKEALSQDSYIEVSGVQTAFMWDDTYFNIVIRKDGKAPEGSVSFGIDGKNAKSAFVAYADRFIHYHPGNDSVSYVHYTRSFEDDSIDYTRNDWHHEGEIESSEECVIIRMPWYDMGMAKPFADRRFGIGIMNVKEPNVVENAFPEDARYFLPGSWGNIILRD